MAARNIAVLANENPAGLVLAARLARSLPDFHVRVSIGGRLSKLLHSDFALETQAADGSLVRVPTALLRRGEGAPPHQAGPPQTLWLCDWKDQATAWYALAECPLIIQCTKATDSRTVAMWLVEIAPDDCVIISLQSGLHNVRELREIFGHPAVEGTDMPLVAAKPPEPARRDSALSVASYVSDDDLAPDDRSESPAPPQSNQHTPPTQRRSLLRASTPTLPESEAAKDDTTKDDDGSIGELERERDAAELAAAASASAAADAPNVKKPNVVILAGLLGFVASCHIDEEAKLVQVLPTCFAPIVVERLSRSKANQALSRASLLERSDFPVMWRTHEETNNWLWGDLVWKTFDAYVSVMQQAGGKYKHMNLYEILWSDVRARRMFAGMIDEARSALRWQRVDLMDSVTSPFGLDFALSRTLLLLPDPLFKPALGVVLLIREPVRPGAQHCENDAYVRVMAPFLNGEVVRIGFESEVETPLNQEVLEALSRKSPPSFDHLKLPPLVPMSSIFFFLSASVAMLALLAKLLQFSVFMLSIG